MKPLGVVCGDCRDALPGMPDACVRTVVTSPPYFGLRDYGVEGQIGLEPSPDEFVAALVGVFRAVRRVLRDDGTVWLNLGDSYANGGREYRAPDAKNGARALAPRSADPEGIKQKDLLGIPWMVAFALRADGWYLRSDIIWAKPNPMPESVKDRPTKGHEYIFLLSKRPRYFYDADAIREDSPPDEQARSDIRAPSLGDAERLAMGAAGKRNGDPHGQGRNKRTVWTVATQPFPSAHFATFPPKLIEPCILAGSAAGDTVLDPFAGAGTVGVVCKQTGRAFIGIELKPEYAQMARDRIAAPVKPKRKRAPKPQPGQLALAVDRG